MFTLRSFSERACLSKDLKQEIYYLKAFGNRISPS
jgi:hypothetical protein